MATTIKTLLPRLGVIARTSAVAVISGFCRRRSIGEINERVAARPIHDQVAITVAVLAALFVLSLIAAQFGWVGMLAFWLVVIVLVN